ncbi:MAG: transposase, partial [Simkania negevensis]|nr:transposase [Simkania negevensis]
MDKVLFQAINQQLEELGLKIKKAEGAVLDATIIDSAARPRKMMEMCKEEEKETKVLIHHSADPDARWLVKGKRFYFGYKGFIVADIEKGFINTVHVTAAHCAECKELSTLLPKVEAERLLADKAYASEENRSLLKNQGFKDGIMHKAIRGKPLSFSKKLFNKLISMKRFIIEQNFGTLKRIFHMRRASYMTRLKVEGQLR